MQWCVGVAATTLIAAVFLVEQAKGQDSIIGEEIIVKNEISY